MSIVPADVFTQHARADAIAHPIVHSRVRLQSIDALRGFVIVLMALDHVRAYFTDIRFDPLDISQTDTALFLTRWITHLCAPTFIFLAGVSAYLISRHCEVQQLRRFLVTRGAWLIVLEFTVVQFAWSFNFDYEVGLIMQVIWAIGASMIILAAMVSWPRWAIGAFAALTIAAHNLLDGIQASDFGAWAPVWNLLHIPTQAPFAFIIYPLIPWIGVMAAGFYAGTLFEMSKERRRQILIRGGIACLAAFIVVRALNGYGDPSPWAVQSSLELTLLSFINVNKYPPSLLYLLASLGIAALILAALERMRGSLVDVLRTFGRVPLFFYVLHIMLAHLLAGIVAFGTGFGGEVLTNLFLFRPEEWGFGLPVVYVAWAVVLVTLYPACHWFAEIKKRRKDWWLSYL